jgi:hypothetical protein
LSDRIIIYQGTLLFAAVALGRERAEEEDEVEEDQHCAMMMIVVSMGLMPGDTLLGFWSNLPIHEKVVEGSLHRT